VRFYERRRILREPARTASGYRVYSRTDLDDICFIKQCQELGFTLKEIQPLVNLHRAAARTAASGVRRPAEFRDIAQLAPTSGTVGGTGGSAGLLGLAFAGRANAPVATRASLSTRFVSPSFYSV
jgi:hypothetical protein